MTRHDLSRRFGVGLGSRLARLGRATARRTLSRFWFPQVPLFILVAYLGYRMLRHTLGYGLSTENLIGTSHTVLEAAVHGAPNVIAGVFLILMSLGLLVRSRLAWAITLIVDLISLVLIAYAWPGGVSAHPQMAALSGFILLLLALTTRRFDRSSIAGASLFAITSLVALLAYAVVGAYVLGAQFSPPIHDLITALYFAVVTMSTVGYGDITPKTPETRLFAISVMLMGITVFATSVSALLIPLVGHRMQDLLEPQRKKMARSNHYVIVSDSALARNTYKELKARDQKVAFIFERAPPDGPGQLDVVVGDPSSLDVLRQADAHNARAVLALGDDDSENAFVVLAAKELSDTVKTVTVVNDARNMARVKRVHPDVIIAPQVLGGELLAMALSGEAVDSDRLMQQLLHFSG